MRLFIIRAQKRSAKVERVVLNAVVDAALPPDPRLRRLVLRSSSEKPIHLQFSGKTAMHTQS